MVDGSGVIIHSDRLVRSDLLTVCPAGMRLVNAAQHRSRKGRAHAFHIQAEGSGRKGGAFANSALRAPVWDQWGIFLGSLYLFDPELIVHPEYPSAAVFHWCTADRFRVPSQLAATVVWHTHRWRGYDPTRGQEAGYIEAACTVADCGARKRVLVPGHAFADVAARTVGATS